MDWNERLSGVIAAAGHLEVFMWARENGLPWDKWTSAYAAQGGHLEVLKWAHEQGCPWYGAGLLGWGVHGLHMLSTPRRELPALAFIRNFLQRLKM